MNTEALTAALRAARPYVRIASERVYDQPNGEQLRTQAARTLAQIDEALAHGVGVPERVTAADPQRNEGGA